jgi:triosephosphate isomerase
LPEAVVEDGACGTFLNHSEAKISDFNGLTKANLRAKEVGLKTLIFAADMEELQKVSQLKPDFIAYEPSELIGGTVSVISARPEIVSQAAVIAKTEGLPLIVGAGVHNREDVKKSIELGAVGVAVASAVVTALDPKAVVLDLMEGFK